MQKHNKRIVFVRYRSLGPRIRSAVHASRYVKKTKLNRGAENGIN